MTTKKDTTTPTDKTTERELKLASVIVELNERLALQETEQRDELNRLKEEISSANERVKRVSSVKQLELKPNQFGALSLEPQVHKGYTRVSEIPGGAKVTGKGQLQLEIDCQVELTADDLEHIRAKDKAGKYIFDTEDTITVSISKRVYLYAWFGKSKNGVAYLGGFINEGADEWSGYQLIKVLASDPRSDFVTDDDGNQRPTGQALEAQGRDSGRA